MSRTHWFQFVGFHSQSFTWLLSGTSLFDEWRSPVYNKIPRDQRLTALGAVQMTRFTPLRLQRVTVYAKKAWDYLWIKLS